MKSSMEYKSITLENLNEEGEFEGWLTKYGEVDLDGDIVEKGAFSKALKEKNSYPLLWQHMYYEPIGVAYLEDADEGVRVKGKIVLDIQRGRDAYILLQKGVVKGLSYGFETVKSSYKNGNRVLQEINLFEVSLVSFPALPSARVESVKSATKYKVLPYQDLPLADRDRSWDAGEARARLRKWASSDGSGDLDKIDYKKYSKAFCVVIEGQEDNLTAYKFPIADVIDGSLKAVPRAIFNAVVRLAVAKMDEETKDKIRSIHLARYYEKMGETPPWEEDEESKGLFVALSLEEIVKNPLLLKEIDKEVLSKVREAIEYSLKDEDKNYKSILETLRKIRMEVKN